MKIVLASLSQGRYQVLKSAGFRYNDVLDKSEAYAIQGAAVRFICTVNSDMDKVIGLPLRVTLPLLKKLECL